MRVLLIDVNCKHSSTGKIVYDLYTNLNNDGHTAAICYGRGPLVKEPMIYKFSSNLEMYAHALLTRVTGLTGIYSPIATRRLISFIQEFNPDVVHIHELHAYFVNISPLIDYLKKKEIRTVWTFHCEFMYTGKCGFTYDCEKWKVECNNCPQIRNYPSSLFFDFTKRMFNDKKKAFIGFDNLMIVTPSKWLANRVELSFLKDKNIRVINNGIDTINIFHPRNFEHLKKKHNITDEKVILSVAPDIMSKRKGGEWVLELARRFENKKVKFILIGVDDLNQKFDSNIIALGRTANQIELAEYYSMADAFVICSKKETFSLTCAEALCCGTPVVGFKSGAPETIFENTYAKFVEYGDINNLVISLNEILNADNESLKQACYLYGNKSFSNSKMVEDYFDLYKNIMGGL